ncbi:MAG TPA: DUF2085 domain-containing protein [Verrucomicrobiae bacterium]|jgi:uncharacterized membrane protein|nr:DUF2085 domain-containing protein [Verrucomicrobiae bacterium]
MKKERLLWIPLLIATVSISVLALSFFAAYTEAQMLDVSSNIYALLRTFCHQMPSHCLWYHNSNYGVCSHCFGIIGGFAAISLWTLLKKDAFDLKVMVVVPAVFVSFVPLLLDVFVEAVNQEINPHAVRILSGFAAGGGSLYGVYFTILKIKLFITKKAEGVRMTKKVIGMAIAMLMVVPANITMPLAYAQTGIQLKRGTPVAMRVTQMVSSETSHIGDLVHLEVLRDVTEDGKVMIAAGTPAEGEVVAASDRGFIGEPGRVGISVTSTTATDGQTVYLRSTLHREGQDKQTLSLVLGILLCFLFLFMKGKEAEIMSGSEVKAYVDNELNVIPKG